MERFYFPCGDQICHRAYTVHSNMDIYRVVNIQSLLDLYQLLTDST